MGPQFIAHILSIIHYLKKNSPKQEKNNVSTSSIMNLRVMNYIYVVQYRKFRLSIYLDLTCGNNQLKSTSHFIGD